MSSFVKYYSQDAPAQLGLTRIVQSADSSISYLVGGADLSGLGADLLLKTDGSGVQQFFKQYTIGGYSFVFTDGVVADNTDIILTGFRATSSTPTYGDKIVFRINSSGNLLWAKVYPVTCHTQFGRGPKIAKVANEIYFLLNFDGIGGTTQVQKIDGSGTVLHSKDLRGSGGYIIKGFSILPDGAACVISGLYASATDSEVIVIKFDKNLNILSQKVTVYSQPLMYYVDMLRTGTDQYLLASMHRNTATSEDQTALISVNMASSAVSGRKFAVNSAYRITSLVDPFVTGIQLVDGSYFVQQGLGTDHHLTRLDGSFNIQFAKRFYWGGKGVILAEQAYPAPISEMQYVGYLSVPGGYSGIHIRTDLDAENCLTETLLSPTITSISLSLATPSVSNSNLAITPTTITAAVNVASLPLTTEEDCSCHVVTLDSAADFQSPHIYMQSSGSDFSDETVRGYHLRWDLRKYLGENHLPKGDLAAPGGTYPTTIGFNRPDDYVRIYKAPYPQKYPVRFNFSNIPNVLIESGATREWHYTGLIPVSGLPNTTTGFIKFDDVAQYDALRVANDPNVNPLGFIKLYTGVVQVGALDKLAFSIKINFDFTGSPVNIKAEAVSLDDKTDLGSRKVSQRLTHTTNIQPAAFLNEDMEAVRFSYQNANPLFVILETYEDFVFGADYNCQWSYVDKFSLDDGLSDSNAKVYKLLEDSGSWTVDGKWPKYNESQSSGEFKVKVDNYKDRWTLAADGLQQAVIDYLTLSQTDTQAVAVLNDTSADPTDATLDAGYLDLINMVSLDYHVARMLGLGFIDGQATVGANDQFVFLMEYVTEAALEEMGTPAFVRHYYMAPPITLMDWKLPPKPEVFTAPQYGLDVDVLTGIPSPLTDPNGYSMYDPVRYINLNRKEYLFEQPFGPFFNIPDDLKLWQETIPVMYGIEYREDSAGPGNYVFPEILHSEVYNDPSGMAETETVLERQQNPVYTHAETQEGIHQYALYAVNWFSRPSVVSDEIVTDYTQFPKANLLLPPLNFQVQLIQPETPLMFTTTAEQARLAAIGTSDKTLVRATFAWNHIHNVNYQKADKIEVFYKESEPLIVKGKIATGAGALTVNPVTHTVSVQTTSYVVASVSPSYVEQPQILSGDASRFVGGIFSADGQPYVVKSVVTTGLNPILELEQIKTTLSVDPDNDGIFDIVETYDSPSEGDQFFLIENLNSTAAWDCKLNKEITVKNFTPLHTETVTYADGTVETLNMGGLYDTATIDHIYEPVGPFPPNTPSGTYTITLDVENITDYSVEFSDPDVEYYQGTIHVPIYGTSELKTLPIIHMDNSGSTLVLIAYDPDHTVDSIIPNTAGTYTSISVNFHPSYRAYFYVDIAGGNNFEEASILPLPDTGSKETYMAARSKDTVEGFTSAMGQTAVLLAREIQIPVAPGVPTGPTFATRPNFYGKSTYTFDVEVGNPYSLIFYRANERRILEVLYKTATVNQIVEDLANLSSTDAAFEVDRWRDLANNITDGSGLFKEYIPGGYRFPIPDNDTYKWPYGGSIFPFTAGTTPPGSSSVVSGTGQTMQEVVRDAIDGAFLPLTEQPAVYKQLQDSAFQTSGKPPVYRNSNGDRLDPSHPDYDPWPMAFRYEVDSFGNILQSGDSGYGSGGNTKYVRFTDFTLDGSSIHKYFYFGVELSNTLAVSERSDVAGPISLVNSYPAEAPQIKKVVTKLYDPFLEVGPSIEFKIEPFVESDGIKQIQVYRTITPNDEMTVRTMTLANTVNVGETIEDNFSDLTFPPYGEAIFYRLVALREILNEQGVLEMIPSKSSVTALANVVDNVNPPAPVLAYTSDLPTPPPVMLNNVEIQWDPTCYNGTYYLYKQTSGGNWRKIWEGASNATLVVPLSTTDLGSGTLEKENADGDVIYHRFRVGVMNASGLLNLSEKEMTI